MLVGAGDQPYVTTTGAAEAGHDIGRNGLIGMAYVRLAVGVADRGRDVKARTLTKPLTGCRYRGNYGLGAAEARMLPSWKTVAAGSSDRRGAIAAVSRALA